MRNIIDGQINKEDIDEVFNLDKEIKRKIRLLDQFGIRGEGFAKTVTELNTCTNQQQLDNVMRKAFHIYL